MNSTSPKVRNDESSALAVGAGFVNGSPDGLGLLIGGLSRGAWLRQHDIDFENLVVALLFKRDLDVVGIDRDVLRDDGDQLLLQVGQEVLFAGLAAAFVSDDKL